MTYKYQQQGNYGSVQIRAIFLTIAFIVCTMTAIAQNFDVSGSVSDATGEPLVGVTVSVEGTSIKVLTNMDGRFELKGVKEGTLLHFTYIGMTRMTLPAQTKMVVVMQNDAQTLEQVVVIGYGSVKKSDLTGSVATVKMKDLTNTPSNSIEGLLQGRAAGLQVVSNSQDPAASNIVRIRGGSSLNGSNAPLVVVDGFPMGDAGDLKQINPADIVNIEVLKDASASAIYGSRGANGVIMITTRKAKSGTTSVRLSQQLTVSQFSSKLDIWRDPVLMAQLSNEGRINGGLQPLYIGAKNSAGIYYPSITELMTTWNTRTNWENLVFRTATTENLTASVSSANDKTSFNLSLNYFGDRGKYKKDNYDKASYNLSVDHYIYNNLRIHFNNILSLGWRNNNGGLAYWRNPIYPVYNEDGSYYLANSSDYSHPLAIMDYQRNKNKMLDNISNIAIEWQVLPELRINGQANYKFAKTTADLYYPKTYTETGTMNNGQGEISNWESNYVVADAYINYLKNLGRHYVSAMLGTSIEYYHERSSSLTARDFVNETLENENMSAGNPEKNGISNDLSTNKLLSYMARLNYTYNNRYLVTITARADGSSKFGKNNKWAFFPSGALSWKAHEEEFVKKLNTFDELKFRLSYGISGNQGISPYQTLSCYGTDQYYNNGAWVTTIGPGYVSGWTGPDYIYRVWSGIPNPDLKWETTAQTDFGIDMAFFNRRLRVSLDIYDKQTHDLLRQRNLALSSSYDKMWVNDGKIQNRGFELTIDCDILDTHDWHLGGTLIFSLNRNKVKDLGNEIESGLITDSMTGMKFEYSGSSREQYRDYTNILAIGQPVYVFYGYRVNGIVQSLNEGIDAGLSGDYALPGEFKYVDMNGDGSISEADKCIIGDPNPDFTTSLNIDASWKNFDFNIFLNGVFGNDILNTQRFGQPSNAPLRWTQDNPTNEYPSLREGRQVKISDWWIEDGSFLRIQNITLGYTFNFHNMWMKKLRIYGNVQNLYTFTKFKGYDPEVGLDGIYTGGYPRLRRWTLGLDFTF